MRKVLPIILIVVGLVVFAIGVITGVQSVTSSLSSIGTPVKTPGTTTVQLQPGKYMVYENRGNRPSQMADPTVPAEGVTVSGPTGRLEVACAYCGASRTTVSINNLTYVGVASFTVTESGDYQVNVNGDGQEVVVGPSLGSTFGTVFAGFGLAGLGAFIALAGLVWLIAGLILGHREPAVQPGAQPAAASAVGGWYPDPQDPGQWRWWDGREWTDQRAPRS